jgi:hypothetical protein
MEEYQFHAQMQHQGPDNLRQQFLELQFAYGISVISIHRIEHLIH